MISCLVSSRAFPAIPNMLSLRWYAWHYAHRCSLFTYGTKNNQHNNHALCLKATSAATMRCMGSGPRRQTSSQDAKLLLEKLIVATIIIKVPSNNEFALVVFFSGFWKSNIMRKLLIPIVYNYFFIRACRIRYVALTPSIYKNILFADKFQFCQINLFAQDVIFCFNVASKNLVSFPTKLNCYRIDKFPFH